MDIAYIFSNFIKKCFTHRVVYENQCVCTYHPNIFGFIIYDSRRHNICHLCGNPRVLNKESNKILLELKTNIDTVLSEIKSFDKTILKNNLESIHVFTNKDLLLKEIRKILELIPNVKGEKVLLAITLYRLIIENRNILLDIEKNFKQQATNKCIELSYDNDNFRAYYEYISLKEFPLLHF